MQTLSKFWNLVRDIFGFRKNSKYVRSYLNDANIKSSIYMSFIIIVLEIWMIIRQLHEYVVPNWSTPEKYGYESGLGLFYGMLSLYFLFIMCSLAMLVFAIHHFRKKDTQKGLTINIIVAAICILWPLFMFLENAVGDIKGTTVNIVTLYLLYFSMPLLGAAILGNTIYRKRHGENSEVFSNLVIVAFAIVCLLFGIKVGYSDYISSSKPKMIICFLSMVIFVACLLIWRPYISIILLTGIFMGFLFMLKNYNPDNLAGKRIWLEGDEINYITFLVSLTMVTISIYQQRVAEATKDQTLIHDAIYDHLCDIHNVRYLADQVKQIQEEADPAKKDWMYLFINITNFKTVNDQKGFDGGDQFLKDLTECVKNAFPTDLVSKLTDDHFVLFASPVNLDEKIENLKEAVSQLAGGMFIRLKVGGYKPNKDDTPNRAIDKARYAASLIKYNFSTTYLEYDNLIDQTFKKNQYIVNHIDEAIENGWIRAYYQPVVWSKDQSLCGAEALARWIDPVYGFLSPNEFIPVLENTRLIHKLDACIIEYVCKNMRKALDEKKPVVPVSINLSRLDFELMDVIRVIETNIARYNIDKKYIHVEITESALAKDTDSLKAIVNTLKKNGYSIWLDDFGSGYSSLNVLKDFDFDVIKIDMNFLTGFEQNERSKDILECVIQLATKLSMKTLTEGVETKEEADFLKRIGCNRLQGFLFGKPFSKEEFEDKISKKEFKVSKQVL